jgi:hypothetical protein
MDTDKRILLVERELGDKLFLLIWIATVIQLFLIIVEFVNLIHPAFSTVVPFLQKVKATQLTTDAYLAIQLAYMGKKELTRWFGSRNISAVETEELVRRIRRGDSAVLLWGILYLTGVLLTALHITTIIPAVLQRTFIQVVTIYTLAFVSKSAQKKRIKNNVTVHDDGGQIQAPAMTEEEAGLLKFIQEHKTVTAGECIKCFNLSRNRAYYVLKKMVSTGSIKSTGKGRTTVYTVHE